MKKTDILQQLDSISMALEASNRAVFPWLKMLIMGVFLSFVPLIEWGFSYVLKLSIWASYTHLLWVNALLHILFYWGISRILLRMTDRYQNRAQSPQLHPILKDAFAISKPILFCMLGSILVFIIIGYSQFIYPIIFLLLGILYNLYGRFSLKVIRYISWSYILAGFAYAILTLLHWPYLWIPFTIYLGLSYFVMGLFLKKSQMKNDSTNRN